MSKSAFTVNEYARRYELLRHIVDFNFKPKKVRQTYKGDLVREYLDFTPAQKAKITRATSSKNDEGIRKNSHLYNVAKNVDGHGASFINVKKSKHQKKKLKSFAAAGIFTTNKGIIVFTPAIENVEIKKRGSGYVIKYDAINLESKNKHVKQRATFKRKEIFIPIPLYIWQSEDLLAVFLASLEQEYNPENFRLAINGRQGKNSFNPRDIYKYITSNLYKNFEIDNPYVTGVFLIYKQKSKIL